MRIFIASLVAAPFALLATFALLRITLDRDDVAVPVVISGLWIIGTLGLIGLGLWAIRDIQARRQRGQDPTQG
jgi:hypothetical protein